ncbi:kinase-like domain-containing protein [Amanita rubescens]|nr:kinase-like domain-containing protein [Amanita rubescens]
MVGRGAAAWNSAPFPSVVVGGDVLVIIIQLCEGVALNKSAARYLARQRCKDLCISLRQYEELPSRKRTVQYRDYVFKCLNKVKDTMTKWAEKGWFYMLKHQADFKADLDGCDKEISDCLVIFTTAVHVEGLAHQQEEEERKRKLEEMHNVDRGDMVGRFASPDFVQEVQNSEITEDDQRVVKTMMQTNLGTVSDEERKRMAENLYKLLRSSGRIPPECQLSSKVVEWAGERRMESGNNIDMYKGRYLNSQDVRIKVIRSINMGDENNVKRIRRQVEVWAKIYEKDQGKHIIPFYGFYSPDGLRLALVSPWMENGNALSYVKKHDDFTDSDYKKLILGIAEGIDVLHSMFIVHGNLRAENVLIGDEVQPLITDFALAKLEGNLITQTGGQSDGYRWSPPEVFEMQAAVSAKGDIYSFGMTILELFTHEMPYSDVKKNNQLIFKKGRGELPNRPVDDRVVKRGLDDNMWKLLCRCWSRWPNDRPPIGDLVKQLDSLA